MIRPKHLAAPARLCCATSFNAGSSVTTSISLSGSTSNVSIQYSGCSVPVSPWAFDSVARLEGSGLPFAPIGRPEDLFNDPHLLASGGLELVRLPDGSPTLLPTLPVLLDGMRINA